MAQLDASAQNADLRQQLEEVAKGLWRIGDPGLRALLAGGERTIGLCVA